DGCSRVHGNPRKGKFKTPSSWSLYDGSVCLISRRKLPLESLSGGHSHANCYLHSALVTRVVDMGTRPKRSGTEAINAGLCLWNLRFGNRHDTQVSFSSGGSLPALRRCTVGRERSWTHDGVKYPRLLLPAYSRERPDRVGLQVTTGLGRDYRIA